jgi:hypothetical protein
MCFQRRRNEGTSRRLLEAPRGLARYMYILRTWYDTRVCAKLLYVTFVYFYSIHSVVKSIGPTQSLHPKSCRLISSYPSYTFSVHVPKFLLLRGRKLCKHRSKLGISRLRSEEIQQGVLCLIVTSPLYSTVLCAQSHELSLGHP